MSQSFRKGCNWRRSIGGRGQEQSDHRFYKSTCGIWGGNGFAAKQSIIRNYNNLTLEDGLFHFIRRVALSCLTAWSWWGGARRQLWQGLYETDRWGLVWMRPDFCPLLNVFATWQNAACPQKCHTTVSNLLTVTAVCDFVFVYGFFEVGFRPDGYRDATKNMHRKTQNEQEKNV